MNTKAASPSYDREISSHLFLVFLVLFGSLGVAVLVYGEPFRFWEHAFSDLGNLATHWGQPNGASRTIFALGMVVDSYLMVRIATCRGGNPDLRNRTLKRWLACLGAAGYLVALWPNDGDGVARINHLVHSIGVGTVVGVMYLFAMVFHLELRRSISAAVFYTDLVLLQIAFFGYAAAFFAGSPAKQVWQKLCVVGVCVCLQRNVMAAKEGHRPLDALGLLERSEGNRQPHQ